MDKKTEESLKRMMQDYEYETTGIPQRLDHVLMSGLEKGLAQADLKEQQIDIQVEAVINSAKQVAEKATYENLKKIFFDYDKMYNEAVKHNKKELGIKRGLKNIFGLASLFCIIFPVSMLLIDDKFAGSDIIFMVLFFIFGIIWWIFQAASLTWGDPEYSGNAKIYQNAMHTILNEGLEKRFEDRFYKDKDFHEYNDMDIFDENELEEPIRENKKKIKKTSIILLAIISIIILVGIIFSISLNSTSPKANNSQENIETNNQIGNNKEIESDDSTDINDSTHNLTESENNNVIDNVTEQKGLR
ncbi:MAG: hypothetical protein HFJ48_08005 [Clostridia bacterium]|nr:hypothetical protein [Clostridia bacterium]